MNLLYLQTFLVVAEEKSFTRAANRLDVSKGLVSRHVKHLEKTLSSKLFHRTTRSINLTEAGQELFEKARQIQFLAREAEMRVKDMTQAVEGNLKVTAPFEFGRAICEHVVPSFKQKYPKVNLVLDFGPSKQDVEMGNYDIAFRAYDILPNDVVAKELGCIRNVIVCHPEWANKNYTEIQDIHDCEFVLNSQNKSWNQMDLYCEKQHYEVEVTGTVSSNTYQSILELALQGLGAASLPLYQVEHLIEANRLVHLFKSWSVKTHRLNLIYAQRRVTPQKITVFNSCVMAWLSSTNRYLF
jgi:DNA-binding transcriptional LysR family regulator